MSLLFLPRLSSFLIKSSTKIANIFDLELIATVNITTIRYISFDCLRALCEKQIFSRNLKWIRNLNASNKRFRSRLALCSRKVIYLRNINSNSCGLLIIYVIVSRSRIETLSLTRLLSIILRISRIYKLSIKRATIKFIKRILIDLNIRITFIRVDY